MTLEELHAQDVENGVLQVVQACGRCHVVKPDPETVGRWVTIETMPTLAEANAFVAGYAEAKS